MRTMWAINGDLTYWRKLLELHHTLAPLVDIELTSEFSGTSYRSVGEYIL